MGDRHEAFTIPFGWQESGEPLIVTISLNRPLRAGDLERIARTLLRLAPLGEETVGPAISTEGGEPNG